MQHDIARFGAQGDDGLLVPSVGRVDPVLVSELVV
jgi:hypothetical protein